MAETLIVGPRGTSNSIRTNLFLAARLKNQEVDVAIIFGQEALAAFAERTFGAPPLLAPYSETITQNMKRMGFSADPMEALKWAKDEGLTIYACGAWADMLGVRDKLPAEMEVVELDDAIKLFAEANKVISGL